MWGRSFLSPALPRRSRGGQGLGSHVLLGVGWRLPGLATGVWLMTDSRRPGVGASVTEPKRSSYRDEDGPGWLKLSEDGKGWGCTVF